MPAALAQAVGGDAKLLQRWQALPRRRFAAGTVLTRIGEPASRLWLVERGLVRFYFLGADGTERNKSFHAEGAWIGGGMPPREVPAPYAIEALEPLSAVELSYTALAECLREFPAVQPLLDEGLACTFVRQAQRQAELLMHDAAERYRRFLEEPGSLAPRLPLHHVANYLGITNVALSRIRRRLGLADARRRS